MPAPSPAVLSPSPRTTWAAPSLPLLPGIFQCQVAVIIRASSGVRPLGLRLHTREGMDTPGSELQLPSGPPSPELHWEELCTVAKSTL